MMRCNRNCAPGARNSAADSSFPLYRGVGRPARPTCGTAPLIALLATSCCILCSPLSAAADVTEADTAAGNRHAGPAATAAADNGNHHGAPLPDAPRETGATESEPAAKPPTAEPAATDTAGEQLHRLWPEVDEILRLLTETGVLNPDNPSDRDRIIEAILAASGYGLHYSPDNGRHATEDDAGHIHDQAGLEPTLLHNRFHYIRLAYVDTGTAEHVERVLRGIEETGVYGMVLDLRCGRGAHTDGAVELASRLRDVNAPVVILVNRDTSGAVEMLAQLLAERRHTVSLGTSTRGQPFPLLRHGLEHGGSVYIPHPDATRADAAWPPMPITPDIVVDSTVDCDELPTATAWTDQADKRLAADAQLRRAADLLIMIQGLAPGTAFGENGK